MAKVCSNGHVNDDANRFCDQCGERLPDTASPAASAPTPQPLAAGAPLSNACPVCGQENVPGTAFCDNCGAALPPPQPAADAPAESAPAAPAAAAESTGADTATIVCPQCGTANDAANRFCDNCGATLENAGQPNGQSQDQAPEPIAEGGATTAAQSAPMTASTPLPTEGTTPPVLTEQTDGGTSTAAPPQTAPEDLVNVSGPIDAKVTPPDAASAPAEAAASAAPSAEASPSSAPAAVPDTSAERQRLEQEIATQRQLVAQLEQMQASFGAATPPPILQGLDEARQKLAQAEADLQALPGATQGPDPAEVARLEQEIATQRQLVTQLEQMQASFGAATPSSILQGLDEARQKLAQAEADLQNLTGIAPVQRASAPSAAAPTYVQQAVEAAPAAATSGASSASQSQASTARTYDSSSAAQQAPTTPAQQAPAVTVPQASGPRLMLRNGMAIDLPRTGKEIVVGREDPVSGIHPDVDLTPHGGEAGGVSRRHALLQEQNGQWLITDLDSTNYTRVDGNRIAPNTPTPLHDGARVQFGRVEAEFHAS